MWFSRRKVVDETGEGGKLLTLYRRVARQKGWRATDPDQERLLRILETCMAQIEGSSVCSRVRQALFGREDLSQKSGVYIYGPVGRGKTAIMNLFYEALSTGRKKRVHFHAFMCDIHARIFDLRRGEWRTTARDGLIARVAHDFALDYKILCFDEFQVDNVVDASILGSLLEALFRVGLFLVLTSNTAPKDLYKGGLHRSRFVPCIQTIENRMIVTELAGRRDYRLDNASAEWGCLCVGKAARLRMDALFKEWAQTEDIRAEVLWPAGHRLVADNSQNGVLRFSFEHICGEALGSADYLVLATVARAIFVDGVPVFLEGMRDRLMRFVTFVDVVYEAGVFVAISAAGEPFDLCQIKQDEPLFRRAASRLMQLRRVE